MKNKIIIGIVIFSLLFLSGCQQMTEETKKAHNECFNHCKDLNFTTYNLEYEGYNSVQNFKSYDCYCETEIFISRVQKWN